MTEKELSNLFIRHSILLIIGLFGMNLIYAIFTPLTIYPVYWILELFYSVTLAGDSLIIDNFSINLIRACIAGSAYFFLLILNLSTPMHMRTRIKSLILIISLFLILNILRIVLFSVLLVEGFTYFDVTHQIIWYFGSTIILIAIWFANISLLRIKSIPAYTDLKNLYDNIKLRTKRKNNRK